MPSDQNVAILLGVHNGATYLDEQLNSLLAQTHSNWSLVASCDAATDRTCETLRAFALRHPGRVVTIVDGPQSGFARNFLSMLDQVPADADFVAFCDHDDFWKPEKLAHQIDVLDQIDGPALTCGRTELVDAVLRPMGTSPLFSKEPHFANALVQNIAGGNTMIFNRAALSLLRQAAPVANGIISHDWWCYQVLSGAGATVIYDPQPLVLYRQHGGNQIGTNSTFIAKMIRIRALFAGRFRDWNDAMVCSLLPIRDMLTAENRRVFDLFVDMRRQGIVGRVRGAHRAGIYRQTRSGQISLFVGVAFGLV